MLLVRITDACTGHILHSVAQVCEVGSEHVLFVNPQHPDNYYSVVIKIFAVLFSVFLGFIYIKLHTMAVFLKDLAQ